MATTLESGIRGEVWDLKVVTGWGRVGKMCCVALDVIGHKICVAQCQYVYNDSLKSIASLPYWLEMKYLCLY